MKKPESKISNLTFLLKLLPAMQEIESVEKIYRFLLAVVTAGRTLGFGRAFVFVVDQKNGAIRGRYGIAAEKNGPGRQKKVTFESMARQVFSALESVEASDLTLQARTFTVPLDWHRSALVKAVKSPYPVLAERRLSEFATDPYFEHFQASTYAAVPIKVGDRVTAVLAADNAAGEERGTVDEVSLLYSLAQQAATAAQQLVVASEQRRRSRIFSKLHETINPSDSNEKFQDSLKLALTMITRAVGGSGCFLKDYTQQTTTHIKSVSDYSPDADEDDIAIAGCFEQILDHVGGRVDAVSGGGKHELVNDECTGKIEFFFACPLVVGGDVAGSLAAYVQKDAAHPRMRSFKPVDRRFLQLCADIIATKLDLKQNRERIVRVEEVAEEMRSNLTRERERARIGEHALEYQIRVVEDVKRVRSILAAKGPYTKRIPKVAEVLSEMEEYSQGHYEEVLSKQPQYTMEDFYRMTKRVALNWKEDAEIKGIDTAVRIPDMGPSMLLDREKITIALRSILQTTESYLKKGDKVLIECTTSPDRAFFCVADNGHGLPGDALSRLFMPFDEIEDQDEKKRALSLAGEIIEKHAGEILIKSSMSWKTILVLSFPKAANKDRRKRDDDRRRRAERRLAMRSN